jgi:hypothetical protein
VSARTRILEAAAEIGYPVDAARLLDRLGDDEGAILIVQAMTDDRFVSDAELATRLDDALGVPAADPAVSALEDASEWHDDEDES